MARLVLSPPPPDPATPLGRYLIRSSGIMAILAVLSVPSMLVPFVQAGELSERPLWVIFRGVIVLVFAGDLITRYRLTPAEGRHGFARRNLIDIVAVAVPALRLVRLGRLVRGLFSVGRFRAFVLGAFTVAFSGALLVYLLEQRAPGRMITSFGDALWWAMATCTTVGYGDVVPVTPAGRFVGVLLMVVGISSFSVVTAQLAARFLRTDRNAQLVAQVEALTEAVAGLERAVRSDSPPPAPHPHPE